MNCPKCDSNNTSPGEKAIRGVHPFAHIIEDNIIKTLAEQRDFHLAQADKLNQAIELLS